MRESKTDGDNVILFLLIMLMILSCEEGLTVPPHRFTIITVSQKQSKSILNYFLIEESSKE